ncbi:MAG TPA: collagen-like protein [Candidatus Saccharimonadales bacterium]|nr:collagen-like protein [Candidatus Saccharimonadales bacterium]
MRSTSESNISSKSAAKRRKNVLFGLLSAAVVVAILLLTFDVYRKSTSMDVLFSVYKNLAEQVSNNPASIEQVAQLDTTTLDDPTLQVQELGNSNQDATLAIGPAGSQGVPGLDGINGVDGEDGDDGLDGTDGTDGIAGIQGPQGIQGVQGVAGAQGPAGQDGTNGVASCPNGSCVSLQVSPTTQESGYVYVNGVVASSFQGNGSSLTSLSAGNLVGTVANGLLSSSVTLQGNNFNGNSQLVQTNGSGELPVLSGANLTSINASQITTGTLSNLRLNSTVTVQGNTFNGVNQLVQLDGSGALPAVSGANLTNLPVGCTDCVDLQAVTPGTPQTGHINVSGTVIAGNFVGVGSSLTGLNASNISSGTLNDSRLSSNVTTQGNTFNGTSQLVQTTAGGVLPVISGENLTNLNASSLATGTVGDARLSTNVTLQGNSFNAAGQLVQLDGSGLLPALNGSALTSLNASNISSGTLADARLSSNVALLSRDSQVFTGDNTIFRNDTNGTNAFTVQNSSSTNVFNVDTSANRTQTTNAEVSSGLTVGASGTAITQIRYYAPTINPANVPAASTSEQTFTVNGLTTDDTVIVNKPSLTNGCGMIGARVSAANTLAISWVNVLGILGCDPPSEVYKVMAFRAT